MRISGTALLAGLALLSAACTQPPAEPAKPEEAKPDAAAPVNADPAFDQAVSFTCEGGGKVDLVFQYSDTGGVNVRYDGGPGKMLAPVTPTDDTNPAMRFTEGDTSVVYSMENTVTYESGDVKKTCTFVSTEIPAPTVAGVVHTLTSADAGKTFEVKVGEKVSIAFVGVPTAGYIWGASKPPAWVKATEGPGGPTSTAQRLPGFAGGSHWEVIVIEAVAAGEGEITLAQRRPWEPEAEPDADTFKFALKAS
jgi:predicted secreted protein